MFNFKRIVSIVLVLAVILTAGVLAFADTTYQASTEARSATMQVKVNPYLFVNGDNTLSISKATADTTGVVEVALNREGSVATWDVSISGASKKTVADNAKLTLTAGDIKGWQTTTGTLTIDITAKISDTVAVYETKTEDTEDKTITLTFKVVYAGDENLDEEEDDSTGDDGDEQFGDDDDDATTGEFTAKITVPATVWDGDTITWSGSNTIADVLKAVIGSNYNVVYRAYYRTADSTTTNVLPEGGITAKIADKWYACWLVAELQF